MDRSMIDATSGGSLMDKTPVAVRHLISNMASNTQQFGIRGSNQSRMVNEIGAASNQRLENPLTKLISLVRQVAVSQHQPAMAAKLCGICTSVEHPTDMCPTLQETEADQPENIGAIVWKTTISGRPATRTVRSSESQICAERASRINRLPTAEAAMLGTTFPTATAIESNSLSLEDLMKQLATSNLEFQQSMSSNNMQFQQNVTATIQDLKTQIGQLANIVSQLQSTELSNLPSQTIPNLRGNGSVVTLRSEKELPQPTLQ
ncbi:hypothetical protein CR513_47318, partial [Mucuna pruriens]